MIESYSWSGWTLCIGVCHYCGIEISGGPGGYHDIDGRERCSASPTSFHEAESMRAGD